MAFQETFCPEGCTVYKLSITKLPPVLYVESESTRSFKSNHNFYSLTKLQIYKPVGQAPSDDLCKWPHAAASCNLHKFEYVFPSEPHTGSCGLGHVWLTLQKHSATMLPLFNVTLHVMWSSHWWCRQGSRKESHHITCMPNVHNEQSSTLENTWECLTCLSWFQLPGNRLRLERLIKLSCPTTLHFIYVHC